MSFLPLIVAGVAFAAPVCSLVWGPCPASPLSGVAIDCIMLLRPLNPADGGS